MVNIGYRFARLQGKITRNIYRQFLSQIVEKEINYKQKVETNVYSLSCQRDLPEQVASIRSFLHYVGIPEQFIVVSDGSYPPESCQLLQQIHPCVKVIALKEFISTDLPQAVHNYIKINPMGKKLAMLLSIPIVATSLYIDADILFFPGAIALTEILHSPAQQSYYLPDSNQALDLRLIEGESEKANPINGGFIVFKSPLDWTKAMERFLNLQEKPNYFTEQTMVHLTLHQNHAIPLNSECYIMDIDDEFIYGDRYAHRPKIVLRHYVTAVRHKFWQNWAHLF